MIELTFPDWYVKNPDLLAYIDPLIQSGQFAILLTGKPGCGKTYLAETIFNAINEAHARDSKFDYISASAKEVYGLYLRAVNMIGDKKSDAISDAEQILTRRLVLLDDLGCETATDASAAFFSGLFSVQYDAFKKGKYNMTIITTNLTEKGIAAAYGCRVYDRIVEHYHILEMTNESWRLASAKRARF